MEYHAVPPEERARDENGNLLPWGYLYKDESRNPRRPPEETGPFGKRRNARYEARSRTRTGTPAKRENPSVAEFGRLFAQQQQEEEKTIGLPKSTSSGSLDNPRKQTEKVATECILYGYKDKDTEWKVIDKYERISQGMICEDYPRSDPNSMTQYAQLLSGGDIVIRANLSADANRKSKRYAGGFHWIKVTFDSAAAADKAIFFSPQEIDGNVVFCELFDGHGPSDDQPIPADSTLARKLNNKAPRTLTSTQSSSFLSNKYSDQQDRFTLPRSFAMNNLASVVDYDETEEGQSFSSATVSGTGTTTTATSATVAATPTATSTSTSFSDRTSSLQQRNVPSDPKPESDFMTHIPTVRRTKLRPLTEALPPQPTVTERVLRSIPILSWFTGDIVGDGPQLREDGTFDYDKSTTYWRFWYMVDRVLGTDVCGLREES
ncbi:hypothetical protein N7495_007547 [Penicillium taxi]|uniref:uncharacterized protein n=1 Tax=Penicillium taxi TaxID=168475 RepID=UPI002544E7A9|nr:uncharacterized protein N7495_007547 [Penicillium taxi]KAJ5887506.1 hypothetical protein N7495_007547 [Penicillium taxi]